MDSYGRDAGPRCRGGVLAMEFDHVEWDNRSDGQVLAEIFQERPLWLRFANFFERNVRLLKALPPGQLVLWKLEHWGESTPFDTVPMSPALNVPAYATELLGLNHRIIPYTFTTRAIELLRHEAPALIDREIAVVPVAQKQPVAGATRSEVRTRLSAPADKLLLGCGGLLHPAKGIDELVMNFLRSCKNPQIHLLCSVVPEDDGLTEGLLRHRWERLAGGVDSSHLHIRVSAYGKWRWMCEFYRAIDVMLVNSISDSWGRMVAEPLGFGVPTVVRKAACATNYLAPTVVVADGFDDFTDDRLWQAINLAQRRAPKLAEYMRETFSLSTVRDQFLSLMRRHTPSSLLARFENLSANPRSLATLDSMIDH